MSCVAILRRGYHEAPAHSIRVAMSKNAHRLAVALMLALLLRQVPSAQNDAGAIVTVPANSEVRSAAFALTATGELVATLQNAAPANGTVRVYVFDQAGVLRGLDDPEVTEPVFTWYPAAADRYYVKVVNTSQSPVTLRIESNPSKDVRERSQKEFASVRVQFATNRQAATEGLVK